MAPAQAPFFDLNKKNYAVVSSPMDTAAAKTKPVPTRFAPSEDLFLHEAARETGLSVSELIRRSVRLMRRQKLIVNSYSFVIELAA